MGGCCGTLRISHKKMPGKDKQPQSKSNTLTRNNETKLKQDKKPEANGKTLDSSNEKNLEDNNEETQQEIVNAAGDAKEVELINPFESDNKNDNAPLANGPSMAAENLVGEKVESQETEVKTEDDIVVKANEIVEEAIRRSIQEECLCAAPVVNEVVQNEKEVVPEVSTQETEFVEKEVETLSTETKVVEESRQASHVVEESLKNEVVLEEQQVFVEAVAVTEVVVEVTKDEPSQVNASESEVVEEKKVEEQIEMNKQIDVAQEHKPELTEEKPELVEVAEEKKVEEQKEAVTVEVVEEQKEVETVEVVEEQKEVETVKVVEEQKEVQVVEENKAEEQKEVVTVEVVEEQKEVQVVEEQKEVETVEGENLKVADKNVIQEVQAVTEIVENEQQLPEKTSTADDSKVEIEHKPVEEVLPEPVKRVVQETDLDEIEQLDIAQPCLLASHVEDQVPTEKSEVADVDTNVERKEDSELPMTEVKPQEPEEFIPEEKNAEEPVQISEPVQVKISESESCPSTEQLQKVEVQVEETLVVSQEKTEVSNSLPEQEIVAESNAVVEVSVKEVEKYSEELLQETVKNVLSEMSTTVCDNESTQKETTVPETETKVITSQEEIKVQEVDDVLPPPPEELMLPQTAASSQDSLSLPSPPEDLQFETSVVSNENLPSEEISSPSKETKESLLKEEVPVVNQKVEVNKE